MEFRKFQKVRPLGALETEGILDGTIYIFEKLDGSNAQVRMGTDGVVCGRRTGWIEETSGQFQGLTIGQKHTSHLRP